MTLQFRKLQAEDVEMLTKYYGRRRDMTCDSVILDSFLWAGYYNVNFAVCEDKALFWTMTVDGKPYASLPVCALEDLPQYFKVLEAHFNQELHRPLEIYLADEIAVEYLNLPADQYRVEELPDAKDYLYSAEKLMSLSGKKLHKKKNHLNSFLKEYEGRFEYRTICCSDREDVWKFLEKWRIQKGQEVEDHLDPEVEGIHEILNNCSVFDVRMGGIYVDDKLEAFSIGTFNPLEKMAIIHIEKANPDIRGLYQYINQQFLIHEFADAEIVNREDDMGLPGLRRAKESYDPIGFARKYRISQVWPEIEE